MVYQKVFYRGGSGHPVPELRRCPLVHDSEGRGRNVHDWREKEKSKAGARYAKEAAEMDQSAAFYSVMPPRVMGRYVIAFRGSFNTAPRV